jgi:hypothetical protein
MTATTSRRKAWLACACAALSLTLAFVGLSSSASAGRNAFTGHLCVMAWNNADFEKDYFWAATGHFHGPWYRAYGEHCHGVRVNIRAIGSLCLDNWGGPGGIVATRTEYDGYVTRSTYITPANRRWPASDHRAFHQGSGRSEEKFMCFK